MSNHARLSPSASSRWLKCSGSLTLEELYPNTTNQYAEYGTAAHELAAESFVALTHPNVKMGAPMSNGVVVDEEMVEHVRTYLSFLLKLRRSNDIYIEQRLDFSDALGIPDSFGTGDALIVSKTTLKIIDLKMGKGVKVNANNNSQLMLYALGALAKFPDHKFQKIEMIIYQPRIAGHISRWVCTPKRLREFAATAKIAALKATSDKIDFTPGKEQCRFCKAKKDCFAYERFSSFGPIDEFDVVTG